MSDQDTRLEIEIVLDDGTIKKGFAKVANDAAKSGKTGGKKFGKGFEKNASKSLGSLKKKILGVALAVGSLFAGREAIRASARQEDAINSLNNALDATGQFTEKASRDFQQFASDIQKNSRYGDELILENAALIQSLGNLEVDGLKGATQAAIDMAAALKIDLRSAATLVGKAAAGEIGSFSRYGVIIKKGADNAETFANALTELNTKFGGRAASDVKTASGGWEQLSNSFGDVLEVVGDFVTKSPEISSGIHEINESIKIFGEYLKSNGPEMQSTLGKIFSFLVVNPTTFWLSRLKPSAADLTDLNAELTKLESNVSIIESTLEKHKDSWLFENLGGKTDKLQEMGDNLARISEIKEEIAAINAANSDLKNGDAEEFAELEGSGASKTPEAMLEEITLGNNLIDVMDGISLGYSKMSKDSKKAAKQMKADAKAIGNTMKSHLAKGISGGIQNVVNSLMNGGNAFQNFAKFALTAMGDMSIQLGEMFILKGLAIDATKGLMGGPAIAAGISLVALGSVMKAYSGSMGGSGSGGTSSVDTGSTGPDGSPNYSNDSLSSDIKEEEKAGPSFHVEMNIQGDMISDDDEKIVRIGERLRELVIQDGMEWA